MSKFLGSFCAATVAVCLFSCLSSGDSASLRREVAGFRVDHSAVDFGLSGATMWELVQRLRLDYKIPLTFEELSYEKGASISLAQGIELLQRSATLSAVDEQRLADYRARMDLYRRLRTLRGKRNPTAEERELLAQHAQLKDLSGKELVGIDKGTVRVSLPKMPLFKLLDEVVAKDSRYELAKGDDGKNPSLSIRPRAPRKSVISSAVISIDCDRPRPFIREMIAEGGTVTARLAQLGVAIQTGWREPRYPGLPDRLAGLPHQQLPICGVDLPVRQVLDAIVGVAGPEYHWTLFTTDGLRYQLSFDSVSG